MFINISQTTYLYYGKLTNSRVFSDWTRTQALVQTKLIVIQLKIFFPKAHALIGYFELT